MTAKEMFEELGFNYYYGDEFITIGQTTETHYSYKHYGITFNRKKKIWFAHINTSILNGKVHRNHLRKSEIDKDILACINRQLDELGWLDE